MNTDDSVPSRYEDDVPAELVELILSAVPGFQPAVYKGLYEGFPLPGLPLP